MIRLIPVLLFWISLSVSAYAQEGTSKWGLPDNLSMYPFNKMNSFLSAPDIDTSVGGIEVRLYRSAVHTGQRSMTSLIYKSNQWTATFYSRKKRTMDDPVDATYPVKIREIKNKRLDSVFVELAGHNVFTLPDQSQTKFPNAMVPYAILIKSNKQIRCYRFQNTTTIDKSNGEEFGEFRSIVELFAYLNDNFAEKNN